MADHGKSETMVKRFSGEGTEPQKEYKRWKRWSRAYLVVQRARGVSETALGAMLFTLLDGAALRAFDATSMDEIEREGGQDLIYHVLDERFPEEAVHDRLGEVLDSIFDLKVDKGETTAAYTGKARAAFSAAEAEGVRFPSVARGYLLLRFSRLPAEKKAVVMAAARQSYEEQDVAAALRTTYPEGLHVRQGSHVNAVELRDEAEGEDAPDLNDVLLADEDEGTFGEDEEPIEEQDAIDVLMTWKQTRQTINREKLSRGLGNGGFKKLEARVKCFKCQKVGHFSRNCPNKKGKAGGKGDGSQASTRVSYVHMVHDVSTESFVLISEKDEDQEAEAVMESWADKTKDSWQVEGDQVIRHHVVPRSSMFSPARARCPIPVAELSSARLTVMVRPDGTVEEQYTPNWKNGLEAHRDTVDTWTGRSVFYRMVSHADGQDDEEAWIADVAAAFYEELEAHDQDNSGVVSKADVLDPNKASENDPGSLFQEPSSDEEEQSPSESQCALVHDAGFGIIDTGCGRGIVGEKTLQRHLELLQGYGYTCTELKPKAHTFRYGNGSCDQTSRRVELPIFVAGKEMRVRLHVVPGHVPLLLSKRLLKSLGALIDLNDNKLVMVKAGVSTSLLEMKDNSYQINLMDMAPGHKLSSAEVDVLKVGENDQGEIPCSSDEDGYPAWDAEPSGDFFETAAEFMDFDALRADGVLCVFKAKERKELQRQVTEVLKVDKGEMPSVVELFNPGRFAAMAESFGLVSRGSFDLSDGWDWSDRQMRIQAEKALELIEPDLAVMSPPCGPLSPLQNLTPECKRRNPEEFLQEQVTAKKMVKWCVKEAQKQLDRNKEYVFESSQLGGAWKLPEMVSFIEQSKPYVIDVPACAVGLIDPESKLPYGKKWRFMTSCSTIAAALGKLVCDGTHKHQPVEGSVKGVMRSIRTQVYPTKLIRIILGAFATHESHVHWCFAVSQASLQEVEPKLKGEARRKVERALHKLHINLGHASKADMERILRHHHAQEHVLELVRSFECSICQARAAPKAVKDSAPPRDIAPLRYVGMDVKFLPSWKPNEKIKALNIVCRSSGLQQMYPFREQENSDLLCRLYRSWTRAYGRPRYLKFDASRCNLGQVFLELLERDGTTPLDVPGEAHEQMGDVESQGRHFEETFQRILDQMAPQDYNQWLECVDVTIEARNSLLRRAGHSPYQLVFGRDPEFPGDDLACEQPNPISNSAILEDAIAEYQNRARSVARQEVLRELDHRAARIALNARPRPLREFRAGDEVAIWRRGKGIKKSSARWRGPGIVAGCAGGNYWVSMPGSFVKCSPEQLRLRTTEERQADRFLVRDLRAAAAALWPEVGMSNRPHQKCFFDITSGDVPPGDLASPVPASVPDCRSAQQCDQPAAVSMDSSQDDASARSRSEKGPGEVQSISSGNTFASQMSGLNEAERQLWEESRHQADRLDGLPRRERPALPESEQPGKRFRAEQQVVGGQTFPPAMPSPAAPETNVPIPVDSSQSSSSSSTSSTSSHGLLVSMVNLVDDSSQKAISMSELGGGDDFVLCCDHEDHVLLAGGRNEINLKEPKKWMSQDGKRHLHDGIQKEVNTVVHDKGALRPLSVEESKLVRQTQSDRIVPSRLVLVEKMDESGTAIVKARWTARGDKDPDLISLIRGGSTQAPTISSNGRYTVMQTIASNQFMMQLGDVTGAFLEADGMERETGPLFLAPPQNHDLPGYSREQLFEVIKPLYGFNDSPQRWFSKFSRTVKEDDWEQSKLDHCVFFLRCRETGCLQGVLGVHVDDVILGGKGQRFQNSVQRLKEIFPFRKWKTFQGTFCGAELIQDPTTFGITVSQEAFADKLQRPKLRMKESPLLEVNAQEATSLKSVLGGALWLARETRPDLAVQVSQGQQILPTPTLGAAKTVGNVVRRAKQYKHLTWQILPIPFDQLRLCVHTDAAFANAKKQGTQAGYLVGVTTDELREGKPAPWSPCVWKSYRLRRVVGSTFAGESQVLSDGLGHADWVACHLSEAKHHDFQLSKRHEFLHEFCLQAIVDCKSIYDHLQSFASPGSIGDKRVAIDLTIIRETLERIGGVIRWSPTWLQLADALTKESPEAMDLLRAAMTTNKYHLSKESTMMEAAAQQRQLRLSRKQETESTGAAQEAKCSDVRLVRSFACRSMVKVAVGEVTEDEIRSLFECMVSGYVKDGSEFLENMSQSRSMCKARIPAELVHGRAFRGDQTKVTFVYTKTTKMIQIQGGATLLDKSEDMMKEVLKAYGKLVRDGEVLPLPEGGQAWGVAIKENYDQGCMSRFLEEQRETADGSAAANEVKKCEKQPFVPEEEAFTAAVADLCNEGARKLHQYPAWRNKFLQYMLREFNASTDQVLELSELSDRMAKDEVMSHWSMEDGTDVSGARPKAKSGGYRPKGQ